MRAVIGIGANLGDRRDAIERAFRAIEGLPGVRDARRSSIYETEPIGPPPRYLNAAIAITLTPSRSARALVTALLAIEYAFGRTRSNVRDAPRTLDLDLLWIENTTSTDRDAEVPHPRLHQRAFALIPLVEVAPDARAPDGRLYRDVLAGVDRSGVHRFEARAR